MSANPARVMAVLGASGSGKSTFMKREAGRARRLLVWDPMREYAAVGQVCERLEDLIAGLRGKHFALVFQPSADPVLRQKQFGLFCRAAMATGNLCLMVEELRFVTTPSRAPLGWAQVCLTGRHAGLTVYASSQRPASIDKDFLGNCTRIRTGRLAYPEDVRAVARSTGIQDAEIAALKPLEWIEKDLSGGKITRGKLTF